MTTIPKPGDVAMIPLDRRVVRAMWIEGQGWVLADGMGASRNFIDARPLVVIDPEAEIPDAVVAAFKAAWREADNHCLDGNRSRIGLAAALREFANPTPRIEEPTGLGAVIIDNEGDKWVRTEQAHPRDPAWFFNGREEAACSCHFADIDVVRVLSEGVPA